MKRGLAAKKTIAGHRNKRCAVCGRKIKVILYRDRSYRGGHYFGKMPLHRKGEVKEALKAGTRRSKIGNMVIEAFIKRSPKPYAYVEYWECPKCYWE